MIKNAVRSYISADDRSFNFSRSNRKVNTMADIPVANEVLPSFVDVWTNPELLEQLLLLSERGLYTQVQ